MPDHKIDTYLENHRDALYKLLEELVLIQSYSYNKKGVDRVGARIAKEMEDMGFSIETSSSETLGDTLIARSPLCCTCKQHILITGHMDTVFPEDTAFNWYKEDETRCFGPGVADMKGGLVVGIFAIKALIHAGLLANLPITFIFNSDEEIGSPGSRAVIAKEAEKARLAYVLEAGGLSGQIVTGRKGNYSARMTITGRAGHAAFAGKDKASAIHELAHKILKIEAMNAPERGISANVGTVSGGIGPNTVPDLAKAALDFRFLDPGDADRIREQFEEIARTQTVPGTTTTLEIRSNRPAMPQTPGNQELYGKIKAIADDLAVPVIPELRQGVSDANLIADRGIPVVDGLGPIGAKDHSEEEYIDKDSLFDRTRLFAHILALI